MSSTPNQQKPTACVLRRMRKVNAAAKKKRSVVGSDDWAKRVADDRERVAAKAAAAAAKSVLVVDDRDDYVTVDGTGAGGHKPTAIASDDGKYEIEYIEDGFNYREEEAAGEHENVGLCFVRKVFVQIPVQSVEVYVIHCKKTKRSRLLLSEGTLLMGDIPGFPAPPNTTYRARLVNQYIGRPVRVIAILPPPLPVPATPPTNTAASIPAGRPCFMM